MNANTPRRLLRKIAAIVFLACATPALAQAPAPPAPAEAVPPYEPQLMRLAEIMGALTFLRDLCGARDGQSWQARMNALLEAENPSDTRRERLAGAFNRGFRGYEVTYRSCTPNAEAVVERFLDEGARLTRDITSRYSGG